MEDALCEQCGVGLPLGGRAPWGRRRFCSIPCRNKAIAEKNRRYAPRRCPVCSKRITGKRLTCSAACGYNFRKTRSRKQKECPICHRRFWPVRHGGMWSKYCSRACANAKASERLAMVEVTCEQCGRIFRRTKGAVKRVERTFCNRVCARKFLKGERHPHWRGGHDANRGPAWLKLAREIRDRDEHVCRRCGRTEAENGKRLDVDHIVPWRLFKGDTATANDPRNLVSLCARCHRIKTATAEREFLRGDCLAMCQYEEAISLPPLFQHYRGVGR